MAVVLRTKSNSIMSKRKYHLNKSIEDVRDIVMNYEDKNYEKICRFLIDELLFHTRQVPFRWIITDYLQINDFYRGQMTANSISWCYTADVKTIKGWETYSFRFPNVCNSDLYKTFNITDSLFQKSKHRHHSSDWYVYVGKNLPKDIGDYLSIQKIVQVNDLPITRLFVNQYGERIDIYFYFKCINTKITITFEPPIF